MKRLFTRFGQVENTTFAILSPDAKTKLTRAGRAPFYEYRNAQAMAVGMKEIADQYDVSSKQTSLSDMQLPYAESLDIGLNIASADGLPLILVVGNDEQKLKAIEQQMLPFAWTETNAGQFGYAKATDVKSLKPITGIEGELDLLNAILVVQPGQFGLSGKVLAQFDLESDAKQMNADLKTVLANFERIEKSHDTHVRLGIDLGIDWESEIPETDASAVKARERARGK